MRAAKAYMLLAAQVSFLLSSAHALLHRDAPRKSAHFIGIRKLHKFGDLNLHATVPNISVEPVDIDELENTTEDVAEEISNSTEDMAEGIGNATEDVGEGIVEQEAEIGNEVDQSLSRTERGMRRIDKVPKTLIKLAEGIREMFLPNFHFNAVIFIKASLTIVLGVAFFVAYLHAVYEDDRKEGLERWGISKKEVDEEAAAELDEEHTPDIILVFHHPTFEVGDDTVPVNKNSIERILTNGMDDILHPREDAKEDFEKMKELSEKVSKVKHTSISEMLSRPVKRMTQNMMATQQPSDSEDTEEDEEPPTRQDVREALLKDIYLMLGRWGFDVGLFNSVDEDEIFMGVTLHGMDASEYYMSCRKMELQLREDKVLNLNIGQDPYQFDSSPPYLPYEGQMLRSLKRQGFLLSCSPKELFKTFEGQGDVMDCMRRSDCIRLIYHELSQRFNLGAAIEEGFLIGWYSCHDSSQIHELRSSWSNWRSLKDLTFVQPISLIREYFGSRVAFTFAWNGLYCKLLLALVAIAITQLVIVQTLRYGFGLEYLKSRQVIGFSLVIMAWSKIAFNLWAREQNWFLTFWNMKSDEIENIIRPQFTGEEQPAEFDSNLKDKVYPWGLSMARRFISFFFTIFFCGFVFCIIFIWLLNFDGKLGIISSMVLSMMIKVFQLTFSFLVPMLTDYENHKFQTDYYDSFLWKLFFFEFVNNYGPFFFLTVFPFMREAAGLPMPDDHDCKRESAACLEPVRTQVKFTLMILCVCSLVQVPLQVTIVRLKLWWEVYQYKNEHEQENLAELRYSLEEQAKFNQITEEVEVTNMMTLVIALGFVLIFGSICLPSVPLCMIVFAVQLRAYAVLLTGSAQRTFPHRARGMGNWNVVVMFLMNIGVIYGGFLFVAYGDSFAHSGVIDKMTGFVLYIFSAKVVWGIIDLVFPDHDHATQLLQKRRHHVIKEINKKAQSVTVRSESTKSLQHIHRKELEAVQDGLWSIIPKFHEAKSIFSPGNHAMRASGNGANRNLHDDAPQKVASKRRSSMPTQMFSSTGLQQLGLPDLASQLGATRQRASRPGTTGDLDASSEKLARQDSSS